MHSYSPGFHSYLVNRNLNEGDVPITSALKPQALFYFYGPKSRIEITNTSGYRLLVSLAPVVASGYGTTTEPPVHQVIESGAETLVLRAPPHMPIQHVIVWIDPATAPPTSTPVNVRVAAI